MEDLAKAVLLAARLREGSFDKEQKLKDRVNLQRTVFQPNYYKMTLTEAVDKACDECGFG